MASHSDDIDLKAGLPIAELAEGRIISGRVDGEEAILVRTIEGTLESDDCAVSYRRGERTLAVATISRDLQSLQTERAMEIAAPQNPE